MKKSKLKHWHYSKVMQYRCYSDQKLELSSMFLIESHLFLICTKSLFAQTSPLLTHSFFIILTVYIYYVWIQLNFNEDKIYNCSTSSLNMLKFYFCQEKLGNVCLFHFLFLYSCKHVEVFITRFWKKTRNCELFYMTNYYSWASSRRKHLFNPILHGRHHKKRVG